MMLLESYNVTSSLMNLRIVIKLSLQFIAEIGSDVTVIMVT